MNGRQIGLSQKHTPPVTLFSRRYTLLIAVIYLIHFEFTQCLFSVKAFAPINKSHHQIGGKEGGNQDNLLQSSNRRSLETRCGSVSISRGGNGSDSDTSSGTVLRRNKELMKLQPEIQVVEMDESSKIRDPSISHLILATRTSKRNEIFSKDDSDCGFKCQGHLVETPGSEDERCHYFKVQLNFDATRTRYSNAGIDICPNIEQLIDRFAAVLHALILRYLSIEQAHYEEGRDNGLIQKQAKLNISVSGIHIHDDLSKRLQLIGLPHEGECPDNNSFGLGIDLAKYIPFLNKYAFRHRGTEQGDASLEVLKMLSARRVPFNFTNHRHGSDDPRDNIESSSTPTALRRSNNIISHQKRVLSPSAVEQVMGIMEEIKSRQWLSTNPDSVDGLPSMHLNLITDGNPLFGLKGDEEDEHENWGNIDETSNGSESGSEKPANLRLDLKSEDLTFHECISGMNHILRPYLYETLLPAVRQITNSQTVEISDVFIRNYGKMDMDLGDADDVEEEEDEQEEESKTRFGLSPHYDVTAYATCVMALDSTAANGQNGLYIVPPSSGISSSNAALRKFIPLQRGDGIVHTYDILHGVDVDPQLNKPRTSLIVWFVDRHDINEANCKDDSVNQPWLLNPRDDVGEFVLGLASESTEEEDGSHLKLKKSIDPLEQYIASASRGNVFSLNSIAEICDDEMLPETYHQRVSDILYEQDPFNLFLSSPIDEERPQCKDLATALWYDASIRGGNRVSQVSLADELMLQFMMQKGDLTDGEQENVLLMASTLFTMAMNQGYDSGDSLRRLMDVECRRLHDLGFQIPSEEFFDQPVVRILMMSL